MPTFLVVILETDYQQDHNTQPRLVTADTMDDALDVFLCRWLPTDGPWAEFVYSRSFSDGVIAHLLPDSDDDPDTTPPWTTLSPDQIEQHVRHTFGPHIDWANRYLLFYFNQLPDPFPIEMQIFLFHLSNFRFLHVFSLDEIDWRGVDV